jgi:predicted permease
VAVAAATVLVFGLAPAWRATRADVCHVLREGGRGAVRGASRFRLGKGLAALQIAVSFVLLLAAGLFVGTLRNLLSVDLGFRADGVLLVDVNAQRAARELPRRDRVYNEILDRLRKLTGVTSASSSLMAPISQRTWNQWSESDGRGVATRPAVLLWMTVVSPGYFQTLGTTLLAGRDFDDHDVPFEEPRVMVINESAARQFFGSRSPLGGTIRVDRAPNQRRYRVIGVVKDAKYERVDEVAPITGFVAIRQDLNPWPSRTYEVRYTGSLKALTPAVRAAVAEVSPEISLEFRRFETQVDESLQQQRVMAVLSTLFGALALLLSMVGLYGVTSYSVATRKGEIGVRMALGRLATSLLYGVKPNDPVHMLAAAAMLATAATLAACLPARRAARIDPMRVLREE